MTTQKRPKDMTQIELEALRECRYFDPEIAIATWYEDDDPIHFYSSDGICFCLKQTRSKEWVKVRI